MVLARTFLLVATGASIMGFAWVGSHGVDREYSLVAGDRLLVSLQGNAILVLAALGFVASLVALNWLDRR